MSRTQTARRKPAPGPAPVAVDHDENFRRWLNARTRQVYEQAEYAAVIDLRADYEEWTAATIGPDAVMTEVEFGVLLGEWPKVIVEMLSVRRRNQPEAHFGMAANRRLLPAIRSVA